jgi:hypothetical protein
MIRVGRHRLPPLGNRLMVTPDYPSKGDVFQLAAFT